ncbi:MAG: ABC transporter ATP-binding protein [Streptococcaceae bacterium]|jgi:ABC-2 type transport system ATP-binding protein|nr:ABC transporter ATP-binding protein [Streptococcaceae bacterium]
MNRKITLTNIRKSFRKIQVLCFRLLSISEAELVAFVGKNGTGKTTLLKIIAGLLLADSGEVDIFGMRSKKQLRRKIRYVQESGRGMYEYLSASQNISYFSALNRMKRSDIERLTAKYSDKMHFNEYLELPVSELSQGNRQKLSLIIALVSQPEIICLDEPTNGLDAESKQILIDVLKEENQQRKVTVIFTSHDTEFIQGLNAREVNLEKISGADVT